MAACREFLDCMFFVHAGCAQKTGIGEFVGLREKCAGWGLCWLVLLAGAVIILMAMSK